jgi:hypothetical protein
MPIMSRPPLFRWLITLLYWWLPPGDGELPLNREWLASTSLIDVVVLVLLCWCTVDWWCNNSETKQSYVQNPSVNFYPFFIPLFACLVTRRSYLVDNAKRIYVHYYFIVRILMISLWSSTTVNNGKLVKRNIHQ